MPHIALPEGLPGISSGFAFRPETAKPMRELAHVLLAIAQKSRLQLWSAIQFRWDIYLVDVHGLKITCKQNL